MTALEVTCWQLAGQMTAMLLRAGAPAVLVLLIVWDSLREKNIGDSIRKLERRALTSVIILALAWLPWYPVALEGQTLTIPPAWYLLTRIGTTVNQSVLASLPAKSDLYAKTVALASANLDEQPELWQEYEDFESDCYLPARQKAATLGLKAEKTSWPGADTLVQTPGLYRRCGNEESTACQRGFLSSQQAEDAGDATSSCRQWWQGTATKDGLNNRLVEALRENARPIWYEALSADDSEAWLQSYLLRSNSAVRTIVAIAKPGGIAEQITDALSGITDWFGDQLQDTAQKVASRFGSAALAWKTGSSAILLLYLAPKALLQAQIFLLALLPLLWPVIGILSGMSATALYATARSWMAIKLWTAMVAVGDFLHELMWQQSSGTTDNLAELALSFTDVSQLLLWYLTASLPWVTPLIGTWLLWRLSGIPAVGKS